MVEVEYGHYAILVFGVAPQLLSSGIFSLPSFDVSTFAGGVATDLAGNVVVATWVFQGALWVNCFNISVDGVNGVWGPAKLLDGSGVSRLSPPQVKFDSNGVAVVVKKDVAFFKLLFV